MRYKDAVLFRRITRQNLAGAPHQHFQDALHYLDDVSLAITQIAVFNAFKLLDQRIHLQLEGPFRVALQGFDQLLGRFRQSRVVENHEVHIQERLKFRRRSGRNMLPEAGEFRPCGNHGRVEARFLVRYARSCNIVMGHLELRMRHKLRMADSDTARDADAVYGEAHQSCGVLSRDGMPARPAFAVLCLRTIPLPQTSRLSIRPAPPWPAFRPDHRFLWKPANPVLPPTSSRP